MKEDEIAFFKAVAKHCRNTGSTPLFSRILWPRDIINSKGFSVNYKRAWYLLEKWSNKGLYDYGVSLDLGWITDKGIKYYETL